MCPQAHLFSPDHLFQNGINRIAQKVGEEAVEVVIEAKDDNKDSFLGEAADLLFHFVVLLEAKKIDLDEVIDVLASRHKSDINEFPKTLYSTQVKV